nr:hypothetical protein BaRGS_026195 [Batillaria attramentaria]
MDFHWSENTVYLSLGAAGSGLMFHQHTDTLAGVVFGKKRWFLYPLTRNPPGGVYNGLLIMEWYKRIYPNLTLQDRPLECIQQAGELIYLPEGTYHATINVGDTIGVAIQRNQPTLQVEKLIRQVSETRRYNV